jgi:hypothetical protein
MLLTHEFSNWNKRCSDSTISLNNIILKKTGIDWRERNLISKLHMVQFAKV